MARGLGCACWPRARPTEAQPRCRPPRRTPTAAGPHAAAVRACVHHSIGRSATRASRLTLNPCTRTGSAITRAVCRCPGVRVTGSGSASGSVSGKPPEKENSSPVASIWRLTTSEPDTSASTRSLCFPRTRSPSTSSAPRISSRHHVRNCLLSPGHAFTVPVCWKAGAVAPASRSRWSPPGARRRQGLHYDRRTARRCTSADGATQ